MNRLLSLLPGLGGPGATETSSTENFTLEKLQSLLDLISSLGPVAVVNGGLTCPDSEAVEAIRQVSEILAWGEKNDPSLFDYFCERRALAHFVQLLDLDAISRAVKVQMLQTIAMLIANVRRATSLYSLLSGNHINALITSKMDFEDEEILTWFVSLLKSLALRLNTETVRFFFDARRGSFPLYMKATQFFDHGDVMVRSAVRCATLSVYRLEDEEVQRFLAEHADRHYFRDLAVTMKRIWLDIDAAILRQDATDSALTAVLEEETDLLAYLHDLASASPEGSTILSDALARRLLSGALLPLLGSLERRIVYEAADGSPGGTPEAPTMEPCVALHGLAMSVKAFGDIRAIVEPLAKALLWPSVPAVFVTAVLDPWASTDALEAAAFNLGSPGPSNKTGLEPSAVLIANPFRAEIFSLLGHQTDGLTVFYPREAPLAAWLLRELQASSALSLFVMEGTRLVPTVSAEPRRSLDMLTNFPQPKKRNERSTEEGVADDVAHENCAAVALAGALRAHHSLPSAGLRALARALADVVSHPRSLRSQERNPRGASVRALTQRTLAQALRDATLRLKDEIARMGSSGARDFSEAFADEWDRHRQGLAEVAEICGTSGCLLQQTGLRSGDSEWEVPSPALNGHGAAKHAICAFLTLRRLHCEFLGLENDPSMEHGFRVRSLATSSSSVPPWARASNEECPVRLDGERDAGLAEGQIMELDGDRCVACGVPEPKGGTGRDLRALVFHPWLFVLAKPDPSAPGHGCIVTLAPLRHVEFGVDNSNPRLLRLRIKVFSSGDHGSKQSGGSDSKRVHIPLNLHFVSAEDCLRANGYLERHRTLAVRTLASRVEEFVEAHINAVVDCDGALNGAGAACSQACSTVSIGFGACGRVLTEPSINTTTAI